MIRVEIGKTYYGQLTYQYKDLLYYFTVYKSGSYQFICESQTLIRANIFDESGNMSVQAKYIKSKNMLMAAGTFLSNRKYYIKLSSEDYKIENLKYSFFLKYVDEPKNEYFKYQWGMQNKQTGIDINILPVWQYVRSTDVKIGVADSGINYKHTSLEHCLKRKVNYDFSNSVNQNLIDIRTDVGEHGTHIAGVISAYSNDNSGMVGVTVNPNIISLKVLGNKEDKMIINKASDSFVRAIDYAVQQDIKIVNCSFCGKSFSDKEKYAMENAKDILFVIAAGNNSSDIGRKKVYPACYDLSNSIVVSAIDKTGNIYETSNYGEGIDIFAPGEDIVGPYKQSEYIKASGTSVATAFVTGVCSILLQIEHDLKPSEIKRIVTENVTYTKALENKGGSKGIIDAFKCYTALLDWNRI